ncbi:MAG: HAMP domain-containing histidine kinase [Coriobacteriales bacterium]|jgi:signal transduction histidine kinase|nr:HAMP domain-containing histidine kinase [Coriobacteriales bacterium]
MKLTWKLFFCTLLITVLVFGAGGFVLITLTFNTALEREKASALEEAGLLRHTFQASVSSLREWRVLPVQALTTSIVSRFSSDRLRLRVTGGDLKPVLSGSGAGAGTGTAGAAGTADTGAAAPLATTGPQGFPGNGGLAERATSDTIIYMIVQQGESHYLQTAQRVELLGVMVSLETSRDISAVFTERTELFGIYQWLMLGMAAVNGILVFALARWTTAPIRRLSKATRSIAEGRYLEKVPVRSNDDLGALTQDFNQMAESLTCTVRELELSAAREHDFVANFAHELKTPLTSIIGYADLLRSQRLSKGDAQLAVSYIFGEGRRLESLSMKLLDLIVMQRRDFELQHVGLRPLLQSIRTAVFPLLREKGVELDIEAASTTVLCEPDLIKTLLLNLIDNACKATGQGGHIHIEGSRPSEQDFRIVVKDDGMGIPEEDLPRITEAFYRADKSRSRAEGGAGLGLALCNEICALHSGTMDIESTEGSGTRVSVTLKG